MEVFPGPFTTVEEIQTDKSLGLRLHGLNDHTLNRKKIVRDLISYILYSGWKYESL